MDDNVYAPPEAELREVTRRTPRPKTAIAVAMAFDLVLSILLTLLIGIGYGVYLALQGASPPEIQAAAQALQTNTAFHAFNIALGGLVSVGAGYLCARLAVRRVYRTVLLAALLLMVVVRLIKWDPSLTPQDLGLSAATLAAYLLGAWLYRRRMPGSGEGGDDAT